MILKIKSASPFSLYGLSDAGMLQQWAW